MVRCLQKVNIGYNLGRRDEVPNQELGKELVENNDIEGLSKSQRIKRALKKINIVI